MDPESKKLLEDTFALAEENNKMLRKVRNIQKWSTAWQAFKIFLIVAVALGLFYYIDPYITKVVDLYDSISGTAQKVNNTSNSVKDFLKKL